MRDTAIVNFWNQAGKTKEELEIPLSITANDLIIALNEAYDLHMDTDNIFNCFLVSENPIAFLKGNVTLEKFGIRNGTTIIYRER